MIKRAASHSVTMLDSALMKDLLYLLVPLLILVLGPQASLWQ